MNIKVSTPHILTVSLFLLIFSSCGEKQGGKIIEPLPLSDSPGTSQIDLTKLGHRDIELAGAQPDEMNANLKPVVWDFSHPRSGWSIVQDLEEISSDGSAPLFITKNGDENFLPLLESPSGLSLNANEIDQIVIRLRVSKGRKFYFLWEVEGGNEQHAKQLANFLENGHIPRTPKQSYLAYIIEHDEFVEYSFNVHDNNYWKGEIRKLLLMPVDEEGAEISIDYIKLIPRNYHLLVESVGIAEILLDDTYVRSFFARSSSSIAVPIQLDGAGAFDVSIAKRNSSRPLRFLIKVKNAAEEVVLYEEALEKNEEWKHVRVALPDAKGKLLLQTISGEPDALAFWGNPHFWQPEEPPIGVNIIFYVIDALRADHLRTYGYGRNTSPNIDALAGESLVFDHCVSQAPWTRSSMASIMTSTYPSVNGIVTDREIVPNDLRKMAETLGEHGYYTAAFIHNPNCGHDAGLAAGYDYMVEGSAIRGLYSSKELNKLVFPWLARNHQKQFFLYIHTMDTHIPYAPEDEFSGVFSNDVSGSNIKDKIINAQSLSMAVSEQDTEYIIAKYDEAILTNDYQLGRLLQYLRELGIYQNTIVVVTSDHGEQFKEHGFWEHGHTCYQEDIRIPLLMKLPGLPESFHYKAPMQSIDFYPTLLSLLKIPVPKSVQGNVLISSSGQLVFGKAPLVFSEQLAGGSNRRYRSISDGRSKAIQDIDAGKFQFYDLARDPHEQFDISHKKGRRLKKYETALSVVVERNKTLRGQPEEKKSVVNEKVLDDLKTLGYLN